MEAFRGGVKNVQFLRKFWGLVPRKRFAVVIAASKQATEVGRYWTRRTAEQVKQDMNATEQFGGLRRRLYQVKEL